MINEFRFLLITLLIVAGKRLSKNDFIKKNLSIQIKSLLMEITDYGLLILFFNIIIDYNHLIAMTL